MIETLEPVSITLGEAERLLANRQVEAKNARGALQKSQRAEYEARIAVAEASLLTSDIGHRDAGHLRIAQRMGLTYGKSCATTIPRTGNPCSVNHNLDFRVVVWQADNSRVQAHFCGRHNRHALHFGIEECADCGSTAMVEPEPEREREPTNIIF